MAGQNVVKMAAEYRLPNLVAFSNTHFGETGLYQLQSSSEFHYSAC